MSNRIFKTGDRIKCSQFLYGEDRVYGEMTGTFVRYNKYGDDICYISFGQFAEDISCWTSSIKLFRKNQQLLFSFMNEE